MRTPQPGPTRTRWSNEFHYIREYGSVEAGNGWRKEAKGDYQVDSSRTYSVTLTLQDLTFTFIPADPEDAESKDQVRESVERPVLSHSGAPALRHSGAQDAFGCWSPGTSISTCGATGDRSLYNGGSGTVACGQAAHEESVV